MKSLITVCLLFSIGAAVAAPLDAYSDDEIRLAAMLFVGTISCEYEGNPDCNLALVSVNRARARYQGFEPERLRIEIMKRLDASEIGIRHRMSINLTKTAAGLKQLREDRSDLHLKDILAIVTTENKGKYGEKAIPCSYVFPESERDSYQCRR